MNNGNLVLAFDYGDMRLGGIQNIIYKHVKLFLLRGAKVIWCIGKKTDIDKGYRDVINNQKIAIMNHNAAKKHLSEYISINANTTIIMLTFNYQGYQRMDAIERELIQVKVEHVDVRNYLVIPNYRGSGLMLEENASKTNYEKKKSAMRSINQKLLDNGNLLFCNPKQREAFQKHYGLSIPEGKTCCIPSAVVYQELDQDIYTERYQSKLIMTVARFDFPHKAYILGLIDAYAKLCEEIQGLELCIIGYGAGQTDVKKRIRMLPEWKQNGIVIIPGVPSEQLNEYFAKARAFVGLAGAASSAAAAGLPTFIARHYCEECEVYGRYIDNSHRIISEEPGEDVIPHLRSLFALCEEEYVAESHNTYEEYRQVSGARKGDIVEECKILNHAVLDEQECNTVKQLTKKHLTYKKLSRLQRCLKSPVYTLTRLLKRYMS